MAAKVHPLDSWHALQARIHELDEKQLQELMAEELKGQKRRALVLRLHMKLNKLRYRRERADLTKRTVLVRGARA